MGGWSTESQPGPRDEEPGAGGGAGRCLERAGEIGPGQGAAGTKALGWRKPDGQGEEGTTPAGAGPWWSRGPGAPDGQTWGHFERVLWLAFPDVRPAAGWGGMGTRGAPWPGTLGEPTQPL